MPVETAQNINVHDMVENLLSRTDELLHALKPTLAGIKEVIESEQEQPPRVIYTEKQREAIRQKLSSSGTPGEP